jgi:putative membrane protein
MTMSRTLLAIATMAGSLALGGCQSEGRSDVPPASTMAPSAQPLTTGMTDTMKTNLVLRHLHTINQEEIDNGKLAMDHAQNTEIRKFGNEMMTDHTNMDMKLTDLAKRTGVDLGTSPTTPLDAALASAADDRKRMLKSAMGARFDVDYIAPQASAHDVALRLIEEGQKTAAGDAKKLLDEARPIVESHRDHAVNLMRGLSFSATAVGGGPAGSAEPVPGASAAPAKKPDTTQTPGHNPAPTPSGNKATP